MVKKQGKENRQSAIGNQTIQLCLCLLGCLSLFLSGCIVPKQPDVYYGVNKVPQKQELRWSNGGLPKIFDPTFAAVPPDTDAVRAIYEGLTDLDSATLKPVPAVAWKWESSVDGREWTFHLRQNAHWSNGDLVTAHDFVQSWQRVLLNRANAPHARLMSNIEGAFNIEPPAETAPSPNPLQTPAPILQPEHDGHKENEEKNKTSEKKLEVVAVNDFELKVKLIHPDPNFPSLVAHPVFLPIHKKFTETTKPISSEQVVTNGAFELKKNSQDGVEIEKAKNYWDAETVNLEKVLFVPMQDVESALTTYKAGDVDAVTNTRFEPLGLKLLEPYKDFRKTTYSALTYYRFNTANKPFDDKRVREALAIALDRERINEDTLEGANKPAASFLPHQEKSMSKRGEASLELEMNVEKAKKLIADAGFPEGAGFPKIRLLINRNDQQKRVANAITEMWKKALNIETEIIAKNWDEYEEAINKGEYDIVRRGMVMQTTDETANMLAMFEPITIEQTEPIEFNEAQTNTSATPNNNGQKKDDNVNNPASLQQPVVQILSEEQALKELPAIPVYFSSSYSLVKPYVTGFNSNLLDVPSLKQVKIQKDWKDETKQNPTLQTLIK